MVREPSRALENIVMTYKVSESARLANLPLIFASSREVYGDIHQQLTDESAADFVVAESPYSASKISGEAFIYSYSQCYELPYIVFRFSNVYGRYDNDIERMERVTPLFISRISKDQPIVIHGKEKILDFTYIDDCVEGICLGLEKLLNRKVVNQTINLAYGQGNSLVDLANLIARQWGWSRRSLSLLHNQEVTLCADISKAKKLLGTPKTSLTDGIPKAVSWCREFEQKQKIQVNY